MAPISKNHQTTSKSTASRNKMTRASGLLTPREAAKCLTLSVSQLTRCVKKNLLSTSKGHDGLFDAAEIEAFKLSRNFIDIRDGIVDPRNRLNDLTGKEWIPETKSYMFQKGLGADSDDAKIEKQHPAPFSFQDVQRLVAFFTKRGMSVLDPFGGIGSTAKACDLSGRVCTSIELSPKYHALSIRRLETEVGKNASQRHVFINGDSCKVLPSVSDNSFDFVVTSPPYWGILHKQDQKVLETRVAKKLDTQYSKNPKDLGNIANYDQFLSTLCNRVLLQCARILRFDRYMAIVVSDFRDHQDFVSFHSDLIQKLNMHPIPNGGQLSLQGIKILVQGHKSLHPYGYPFAYVENVHHQYILIFRKRKIQNRKRV